MRVNRPLLRLPSTKSSVRNRYPPKKTGKISASSSNSAAGRIQCHGPGKARVTIASAVIAQAIIAIIRLRRTWARGPIPKSDYCKLNYGKRRVWPPTGTFQIGCGVPSRCPLQHQSLAPPIVGRPAREDTGGQTYALRDDELCANLLLSRGGFPLNGCVASLAGMAGNLNRP